MLHPKLYTTVMCVYLWYELPGLSNVGKIMPIVEVFVVIIFHMFPMTLK